MPETGMNVNGLVMGLRQASVRIFFALMECLFAAIEELAVARMMADNPGRYVRNGSQPGFRQLRTSLGLFRYRPLQLYDKEARKTVVPLRLIGFLPRHRRYTDEAAEGGIGAAVHISYRLSSQEVGRIREQAPAASAATLHRRLQEFAVNKCAWPDLKKIPYRFLMVDGTKVRRQGNRGAHLGEAEMRWALASPGEGQAFEPVGFWIDKSWQEIKHDLATRLDYSRLEILFSDGGPGIGEAFLEEGMVHQRCVLHGKRDFSYILYQDGFNKEAQAGLVDKLKTIPVFHFNKERLERLNPADEPKVRAMVELTEKGFRELVTLLDPTRYPKARVYVENLACNVGTFFSWWLDKKTAIALDTNQIESAISRVKNRIWSVGKRWSDTGLLNWLQVTLYKVFHPEMWQKLWSEYLSLNPEFQLISLRVNWKWC
jgi:hypothetical protein